MSPSKVLAVRSKMKKLKQLTKQIIWSLGLLLMPLFVKAQLSKPSVGDTKLPDLSGGKGVAGMIAFITKILLGFAGAIAVLFIIIGGFQYLTSGANPDLAKKGKVTLQNALIGLVIIILSFTVVSLVYNELVVVKP